MSKIAVYIILVLVFLGLARSFSTQGNRHTYIQNDLIFSNFFKGENISVILDQIYSSGFLIKTHFHRYKIFNGFSSRPYYRTFRVSRQFQEQNIQNIGMSIFRRKEISSFGNSVPLPPGSLYIGDLAYGNWVNSPSGMKKWHFHRAYRHYPRIFGWKKFRPTKDFYKKIELARQNEVPFFGEKGEFGTNGTITGASSKAKGPLVSDLKTTVFKPLIKKYTLYTSKDYRNSKHLHFDDEDLYEDE
ncbi:MAG: hypothetical protein HOE90_18805 [Bacteriovoracaceae bacterium]|jgi:hypothetical protein|nr:hypothetical protein [Bacteriovoracaceae bacterium]